VTPHYVVKEDARFFHQYLKNICDASHQDFYPKFKTWADDYFYIKHRQETRGIGGIFYDKLTPENTLISWEKIFEFSKNIGRSFVPIYTHLVNNREKHFTLQEKQWQF